MTEDLNELLRQFTGEIALARGDIAHLRKLAEEGLVFRERQGGELHAMDIRLVKVEGQLDSIEQKVTRLDNARAAEAPSRAQVAAWLTIAGLVVSAIVAVILAVIPSFILDWWRSE